MVPQSLKISISKHSKIRLLSMFQQVKILNAKTHIALGQSFLLMTLLLGAVALGLVPDRQGALREGRAALAEAIAMYESEGYRPIERYNDNPYAMHWFEKRLVDAPG